MRVTVVGTLVLALCACATDKLAVAPPAGVDFSGYWHLNEEESDDPLRLVQSQDPSTVSTATGPGSGQGGRGGGGAGRGGGRSRGGGGGGFGGPSGAGGPAMPGVNALGDGLRWPGKELQIKQVGGVVAITSGGINEVYQPSFDKKHRRKPPGDDDGPRSRDMPDRERGEGPPAQCGWEEKTLVVQGGAPDEDHPPFEQRYSLSEDGQRLIEVVSFIGGRANGFTMSRTWDRSLGAAVGPAAPPGAPTTR